jgi:hypothetical protein
MRASSAWRAISLRSSSKSIASFSTLASGWRNKAARAVQGATSMPKNVKVMKPSRRAVFQNGGAPAAVLNRKATKKAKGTVTPTAATCRAQRAIHLGKRRGHCSNRPKASSSARPTPYTRATSCHSFASQPKLNSKVNNAQSMATVRTRRQPNRARQFEGGASALSWAKGLEVILSGC